MIVLRWFFFNFFFLFINQNLNTHTHLKPIKFDTLNKPNNWMKKRRESKQESYSIFLLNKQKLLYDQINGVKFFSYTFFPFSFIIIFDCWWQMCDFSFGKKIYLKKPKMCIFFHHCCLFPFNWIWFNSFVLFTGYISQWKQCIRKVKFSYLKRKKNK